MNISGAPEHVRSDGSRSNSLGTKSCPLRCEAASVTIANRKIVDNVSIRLMAGEVTALVGPNGAGKSTLLSVLSGDRAPTTGTVRLNEMPIGTYAPMALARQRSVLSQHTNTLFTFTAHEVVAMGRFPWDGRAVDDSAIADHCLERVHAQHVRDQSFSTLSGGERALVNLARILAQDCPVVLLDEPTAALDIGHQELVLNVAANLANEGRTVVLAAHDLNLAARYAHRVLVLDDGHLVADGAPVEALDSALLSRLYRHPVVVLDHPFLPGRPLVLPAPC